MRTLVLLQSLCVAICLVLSGQSMAAPVDCDPDPGTDMLLTYSDSVSCVFETSSDIDVFRFQGNAGDQPIIQLVSPVASISLFDPQGAPLFTTPTTRTARINTVILPETGVYTIVATAHINADNWDYTLELPCLAGRCANAPLPPTLGYTAVSPCRIVDTRFGIGGAFDADETRHFHVYGDISDQNKAGGGAPADYPDECPFALGEADAVHINLAVVPMGPAGQGGFAAAWPWGQPRPAASFINYTAGVQTIANAGVVAATADSGDDPDISVYALRNVHIIIDVMGYYTK